MSVSESATNVVTSLPSGGGDHISPRSAGQKAAGYWYVCTQPQVQVRRVSSRALEQQRSGAKVVIAALGGNGFHLRPIKWGTPEHVDTGALIWLAPVLKSGLH